MNQHLKSLLAGTSLALAALGAHAQASTASLSGWSAYGDASAAAGAITLTTAYMDGDTDQAGNVSGTSAVGYAALTAALGLPATGLDLPSEEATEGSMVVQTFNMLAGQSLSFGWSFASTDTLFSDRAYFAINGQVVTLATTQSPGAPGMVSTYNPTVSGPVTLAIGIVDTGDFNGVSKLTISNLQVAAIPEPASVALWLAGLVGIAAVARRRRQTV